MNAAARQINQTTLFNGRIFDLRLSKTTWVQFILLLSVLISAIAVVYSTNSYRVSYNNLQLAEQHENQMQLHWGQLLLEQASLSRQSRIQQIAAQKLDMVTPASNQINTLRLQ